MKRIRQLTRSTLPVLVALIGIFNIAVAQSGISGTVTDASNRPLSGVSVMVKGTKNGTSTDLNGRFSINVAPGSTLIFSYVGFVIQETTVKDNSPIGVQLQPGKDAYDEVVVTALGIRKERKRIGYAVQEVKGEELVKAREPNVINSLTGKVAGLRIAASSNLFGDPGISLRGRGTIIVVDGVRINSDSWNLSADDIENFSILKGPTAAAKPRGGPGSRRDVQTTNGSRSIYSYLF